MSKPMSKVQLVAAIADAMGSDKKTATAALTAISDVIAREVADRKSTRQNSSHITPSRMPSSA